MLPRSGDVLHVTREASVQFIDPMLYRVIRVHDWPTYDGWIWLDGYELNGSGEAVERRSIFVRIGGLRTVGSRPDVRQRNNAAARVTRVPAAAARRAAAEPRRPQTRRG